MTFSPGTVIRTICLTMAVVVATAFGASANVIVEWNARAEAIAVKKKMLPPPNARGMAILHVAMFEAVNAVERRYASYRLNLTATRDLSKEAAAAAAAHAVLVVLHPDEQDTVDAALQASLAGVPDGPAKVAGVALGKKAAAEVLAMRAKDGASAPSSQASMFRQ